MTNVLDLLDQTAFVGEQATGAVNMLQCVWVYDRAIDIDGLRRFHRHLQRGRLSRRIEQSPLPFGRHRWVAPNGSPTLEIVETPRPREEFDEWLREQSETPMDLERGPGWHLGVLPFTDGGWGVSLAVSHCLADGVGLSLALADAASGIDDPVSWPAAGSRRRWRAVREDAAQTFRDMPAVRRAVRAAASMAKAGRQEGNRPRAPKAIAVPDEAITLPSSTIFVDVTEWDARAKSLGGSSNALLGGLAADVAQRVGRLSAKGTVTLAMPVNERTDDDTRANALGSADVVVKPTNADSDLTDIRAAVKAALIRHAEAPDERLASLAIVPLLPKWVIRGMVKFAANDGSTVASSNIGDINPAANRPDGTDADYFSMRLLYPHVTAATLHRAGGVVALLSGRVNGRVFVTSHAYLPGWANSDEALRETISSALADFRLTAVHQPERPAAVAV
jgi:hypothetical protein